MERHVSGGTTERRASGEKTKRRASEATATGTLSGQNTTKNWETTTKG